MVSFARMYLQRSPRASPPLRQLFSLGLASDNPLGGWQERVQDPLQFRPTLRFQQTVPRGTPELTEFVVGGAMVS